MANIFAQFDPEPAGGNVYAQFDQPAPQAGGFMDSLRDVGMSTLAGIKNAAQSAADTVLLASPVGTVQQMLKTAANLVPSAPSAQPPPRRSLMSASAPARPMSAFTGQLDYTPKTAPGRYAKAIAENLPTAAVTPGGIAARAANVVVPAVTGQASSDAAQAAGAGQTGQQIARLAGMVGGGALASIRPQALAALQNNGSPEQIAADILAKRGGVNPEAMQARAADLTASGVQPSALDVINNRALRLIRAVGVKNPDAGEVLANNAATVSSAAKPAVMVDTSKLGAMPGTTADELADTLDQARDAAAISNYAEPYAQSLDLNDRNVIQALRDPEGLGAINRAISAARANMDYKSVADLEALKATASGPTGDTQVWPTTGRALDRVQIALGRRGAQYASNNANDIASGYFKRQGVINDFLDQVPGLQGARTAYHNTSQALGLLTGRSRLDPFSTDPADYGKWLDGLSPEAQTANQVAIRQDILNTLGGQRSGTMGTLENLGTSPYAQQNLRQALGPEADDYISGINARLGQVRNARFVDAGRGSQTAPITTDLSGLMDVGKKVINRDWIGLAAAYLKSRGLSSSDATSLAQASTDPTMLPGVMARLQDRLDQRSLRQFLDYRNAALVGGAAATMGAARPTSEQTQPPQ